MNRYNKISPDVRQELESQLAARFTKTSKTGMAKRLLKGEDVENHLTKTFKEHSDKTTKDIDKKTQDAIVSINQRIDAVLKYMQSVVQAKVDGIRVPEDGRTPSADEIKALLSPMVDETRTQFTQRISKIEDLLTKAPKESDVPTDLKGLEAFVKSKIPKLGGGGGGASYLFELFDTPAKSKSRQGAYVGYEGLVLAVSDDGKSLVFQESGSSLPDQSGNNGKFLSTDGTDASWETVSAGSVDVVSNVATDRILGRTTAGTGDSEQLTASEVRTLINVEDGATADQDLSGLLPKAGGTMTGNIALNGNYLSGDGGDEGVFVDSSGNVGIGTTTPGAKLHVAGTARFSNGGSNDRGVTITPSWTSETDNGALFTAYGVAGESSSNGTFRFDNLGGNLVTIDSTGNVGIGTTTPTTPLNVVRSDGGSMVAQLHSTIASSNLRFSDLNTTIGPFLGSVGNDFNFVTNNTSRLRITDSGNVGIGTTNPGAKLQVVDAVTAATSFAILQNTNNGSNDQMRLQFLRGQDTGSGSNKGMVMFAYGTGGSGGAGWADYENRPFEFWNGVGAAATRKMSILTSGNVGIGTIAPDTKLHVAGAITQEPLSSDPADPDAGNSVQWVSDGTGSGDAGDVMMKINVGGTTKVITLIDYSVA